VFCIGLGLGAIIGLVAAFLATPYNGKQVRAKINERVDELRKRREMARESDGHPYEVPAAATFERG
jgi:gas vesicle protein